MKLPHKPLPSQERLHQLIDYNPETGQVIWRKDNLSNRYRGRPAGYTHPKLKRPRIKIDQVEYHMARVLWMHYYGEDPGELGVDHKDRNARNNKISNLRLATPKQNTANQESKGWYFTSDGRYQANIHIDGKRQILGYFQTREEAEERFQLQHAKIHGEFSPYFHKFSGVVA